MTNTDHGIVVAFTCWCGAEQTLVTGRASAKPRSASPPERAAPAGFGVGFATGRGRPYTSPGCPAGP